jgi:predicted GTPase
MGYGAGVIAAQRYGAAEIVDPRPFARGSLVETFRHSPWIVQALPAMGYSSGQLRDLAATVAATPRDTIVIATPVDLSRLLALPCLACRVSYELEEIRQPELSQVVNRFVQEYVRR